MLISDSLLSPIVHGTEDIPGVYAGGGGALGARAPPT